MRKIKKITSEIPLLPKRKRVAAYARVSVNTQRLMHSLSAQVSYYSELIQSNPEWEYAGVYADCGVSGTSTAHRDEFQRLLADCEAGAIDIVLTKSISRFARNTLDLLEVVRHLKELGVEVRFEKENINSLSGDGELMLTLLASFAQEESRSISENIKWSIRKRFEAGIPNGRFRIFGYRWDGDHLVIQPEEAAVVRRIYQNFLDGKSRLETEREFAAEGITTLNGCRWVDSSIKEVLTNITYTGNLLFQKEYVSDPFSHKKRVNHGDLPQYFVEESHEAIIGRDTFDYVQSEIARRRELCGTEELEKEQQNLCDELSVLVGLIEGCIAKNARIAQDQETYQQRYDELTAQYEAAKERLNTVQDAISNRTARGVAIGEFIKTLEQQYGMVTAFDSTFWNTLLDHAEIFNSEKVQFCFKNGITI